MNMQIFILNLYLLLKLKLKLTDLSKKYRL